ncbi:MAG: DNA alkylation repair protein [Clostridia bacterium]|nr:DNA alkylation repair protein [Clostridia bacterium]
MNKMIFDFTYQGVPIERLSYRDFRLFLQSIGNPEKAVFEQKIANTHYDVFGLYSDQKDALFRYLKKVDHSFVLSYPNEDYETILLKGRLIANQRTDPKKIQTGLNDWLRSVDSWAFTDSVMKGVRIKKDELPLWFSYCSSLVPQNEEFVIRFGVILLMSYFLTDEYIDDVFDALRQVKTGPYYVDMAIAWLCATALIRYKSRTLAFLKEAPCINDFIVKTSFRKARESFRISDSDKEEYKTCVSEYLKKR